ncbi:MAG: PH domain-containing protein, partial [Actinobacteria bacterium]|nr:PH domain-containing protein [Actinomycetota bacterium]
MSDDNTLIPPIPVPPIPVPPRSDDANGYAIAGGITPGPHNLHKVVILLWALRFFVPLAIVAMSSILAPFMEGEVTGAEIPTYALVLIPIVIIVLVAAIACVYAYLSYKNFTWEITDTELHVSRGIISKKQTHIPFQRIHSLDSTAKLIDRLLGVVTLNVQTAGSSRPEAVLAGLKLSDAEALRAEIFKRKSGLTKVHAVAAQGGVGAAVEGAISSMGATVDQAERSIDAIARGGNLIHELDSVSSSLRGAFGGQTYSDEAPIEFERKLSTKELLLAAVSGKSTGALVFAVIAAGLQLLGSFGVSDDTLMSMTENAFRYVLSMGALAVAGLIFFLVVIIWLVSVFSSFLSYGGFTVRRRGGRLEVERGLLSRRFNGIAIE